MTATEIFKDTVKHEIHREGIDDLMGWLEVTDFFKAPASTRFHEAFEGGLVLHSINVYSHLVRLNEMYKIGYTKESMAIAALFHDVCKADCYKVSMKNVKDEETGVWRKEPYYTFNEDFKFGGHGSKSVYLIQNFMKLTPDEATAINCHMGVENAKWEVCDAHRACPLAFLLHTADMASTVPALNEEVTCSE